MHNEDGMKKGKRQACRRVFESAHNLQGCKRSHLCRKRRLKDSRQCSEMGLKWCSGLLVDRHWEAAQNSARNLADKGQDHGKWGAAIS
eukprot:6176410-Pleurochrysis_carterae.AAC.2